MAGQTTPTKLYTIDIDGSEIPLEEEQPYLNPKQKKI
jgi:hypothetical protein